MRSLFAVASPTIAERSRDRMTIVAVAIAIASSAGCAVAASGECAGHLEVERRELYLRCLHEYSLGAVLGVEEGDDQAAIERCAALAGLDVEDVQPQ